MHALHLPPTHLWRTGLLALGLTLVLLVLGALVTPGAVDLSPKPAPTVQTTATSQDPAPPTWKTDPLAPPSLLAAR
jgi:hypothetical protein